jgi:GntR family transcriptional regulator
MADQDFAIILESSSGIPFYRQIIQQIEYAAVTGALPPGERLPTIRALAISLKVNPNTIAKAYAELELRGVVKTQVGCGTFVLPPHAVSADRANGDALESGDHGGGTGFDARVERAVERFIGELASLGIPAAKATEIVRPYTEER